MRTALKVALLSCSALAVGCSGGQSVGTVPLPETAIRNDAAFSVATALALPNDLPTSARAGVAAAYGAPGDGALANVPRVSLVGPGASGAKSFVLSRANESALVGFYFPANVAIATGWIGISFGESAHVGTTASLANSGRWSQSSLGTGAVPTVYGSPARVVLYDLSGNASFAAPVPLPSPTVMPMPPASPSPTATPVSSVVPHDFPSAAAAGAIARLAGSPADRASGATVRVTLQGPGAARAESFVYMRPDGSAVAAIYTPQSAAVATGWLGVALDRSATVPTMATYRDGAGWSDRSPGIGATRDVYLTPARVLLVDLDGNGAAPSPVPVATATPIPKPTSTAVPVGPGNPPAPIDAPDLSCSHFASNPMCSPLPASPRRSASSAMWAAEQAQPGRSPELADLQIAQSADPHDRFDNAEPLYALPAGTGVPHVLACNREPWSAYICNATHLGGTTVLVPAGAVPAGNSDEHLAWSDTANRREVDLWLSSIPDATPNSTLPVGGAGQCLWGSDGTACSGSTATNIATSLGDIQPALVGVAEADPHGTLPYALSTSFLCADTTFVYPANASDGSNTNGTPACAGHVGTGGRPPEGTRWYIDKSDDEIDATTNAPYVKALLRTLDREHFGGTITDTNWSGAPGPALQSRRGDWRSIVAETGRSGNDVDVPITSYGLDLARDIVFCSNGTCR